MRSPLTIGDRHCTRLGAAELVVPVGDARSRISRLLDDVVAARSHMQAQLVERGGSPDAIHEARITNLQALTDYATAIESLSWPVPHNIQMEIKLHQSLCSSTRPGVRRVR